jgi:hypothetical protein
MGSARFGKVDAVFGETSSKGRKTPIIVKPSKHLGVDGASPYSRGLMGTTKASIYQTRAEEMRRLADKAQTESQRLAFLRLEASWRRLADQAEKAAAEKKDKEGNDEP